MRSPSGALIRLSQVALVVVALDLATKALADWWLRGTGIEVLPWVRLQLVHNLGGAFGLSAGAYTWQLNLALTICAIVVAFPVARDLARFDSASPRALGLIVGGALGNLCSLVAGPPGVADFIGLHLRGGHGIVLNIADLAAYVGLATIARTGMRLLGAIREEARANSAVRLGSLYRRKEEAKGIGVRRPRETVVRDWSQVVDLGVVRADGPAEPDLPRPLGATPRPPVRLVPKQELADAPPPPGH